MINGHRSSCEVPANINENFIFIDRFSKNTQISHLVKVRYVGAEFHADGWTDMTKVIVAFHTSANAPQVCRDL